MIAVMVRVLYVVGQEHWDPTFSNPMLDGRYYLAEAMSESRTGHYLAPLYANLIALCFKLSPDNFTLLYISQHLSLVTVAVICGRCCSRHVGEFGGVMTSILMLTYHPLMFFSSVPLAEVASLCLLGMATALGLDHRRAVVWLVGPLLGSATLLRPSLLLILVAWIGLLIFRRKPWQAGSLMILAVLPLGPGIVQSWTDVSHFVPVSSNSGLTLYHGNAPGAEGVFMLPAGFSGNPMTQREEATKIACLRSGLTLDAIEADRWWGARAIEARVVDPLGSLTLVTKRLALTLGSHELALDYSPSIDVNPWKWATPVPWEVVLGLAFVGFWNSKSRNNIPAEVWLAIFATALIPLLFYVSSRYRLPLAFMLCIPAGAGCSAVASAFRRRRYGPLLIMIGVIVTSAVLPSDRLAMRLDANALANRAVAWFQLNCERRGLIDLHDALSRDADSAPALYGMARWHERNGRLGEASRLYRRTLQTNPAHIQASNNLGRILLLNGQFTEAITVLSGALEYYPYSEDCTTNLVAALFLSGETQRAERLVTDGRAKGLSFNEEMLSLLRGGSNSSASGS